MPDEVLEEKAKEYVQEGHINEGDAEAMLKVIAAERGHVPTENDGAIGDDSKNAGGGVLTHKLSPAQLEELLAKRIEQMRAGRTDGTDTDQYRVFKFIIEALQGDGKPLRLMVQASAGTGKSFLLATVFLWCLVHKRKARAGAPTGIAAANIEPFRIPAG